MVNFILIYLKTTQEDFLFILRTEYFELSECCTVFLFMLGLLKTTGIRISLYYDYKYVILSIRVG